jgi:hypothetical protein
LLLLPLFPLLFAMNWAITYVSCACAAISCSIIVGSRRGSSCGSAQVSLDRKIYGNKIYPYNMITQIAISKQAIIKQQPWHSAYAQYIFKI